MLPPSMLKLIQDQITPAILGRAELRLGLRYLLSSPQAQEVFQDKIALIHDFLSFRHTKFIDKYVLAYSETDA